MVYKGIAHGNFVKAIGKGWNMKSRTIFYVLITIIVVILAKKAFVASVQPEFRAVGVHAWLPGLLSKAELDDTIKWAVDSNMNVLVVQARRTGDAFYNSSIEPRSNEIKEEGFDPLGYAVEKGHANGLEVHAWFNVFRVWGSSKTPPYPNHVVNLHPEWINKDFNGKTTAGEGCFLDPGIPEVREYTLKVLTEIVKKYDIDGIMLDYIRYPGREWGYSDIAVARFNKQYNRTGKPDPKDPLWAKWRREQVTQMVRDIYRMVEKIKPRVKVCAATIPWGDCPSDFTKTDAYATVFQDWRRWMQEGILDANMPMNYKDPANPRLQRMYLNWLDGMKRWSYGRHAYTENMIFKGNIQGAIQQIKQARAKGIGVFGFAFSQSPVREALGKALREQVYREKAPVPKMPWKKEKKS